MVPWISSRDRKRILIGNWQEVKSHLGASEVAEQIKVLAGLA